MNKRNKVRGKISLLLGGMVVFAAGCAEKEDPASLSSETPKPRASGPTFAPDEGSKGVTGERGKIGRDTSAAPPPAAAPSAKP